MRVLRYAKTVTLRVGVPATFDLVPLVTIEDDHVFFDEIVAAVREAGFSYTLVEQTEALLERSTESPPA